MADSTWTIPIDGSKKAIGPFPFTVRKVTIQNRCAAGNVWAVDDKGAQYEATPLTAVESKAGDTVYLTVYIDAAQAVGAASIIVSDEEPVLDVSTSQLSSQATSGPNVIIPTVPLATFPPAAPVDGQVISLLLPAAYDPIGGLPKRWLCTYDAANALWHVSGPPLFHEIATAETPTSNVAYVDCATVGPSVPIPRNGDYQIDHGFQINGINQDIFMAYAGAGIVAADADSAQTGNTANYNVSRSREKLGLVIGTLVGKYKGGSGSGQTISNRWIKATPLRIS